MPKPRARRFPANNFNSLNTHRKVCEEHMAPLLLYIEEDKEDTDHHGKNNTDHHNQTTVQPAAGSETVGFVRVHLGTHN